MRSPAIGELEDPVAAVEPHDADGVAAQVFAARLGHGDDAAGRIHEFLMDHDAGNEAVRHQVGLHLDDAVEPRIALGAVGRGCLSLLRSGWHVDALRVVRHAGQAADPLVLDGLHRLTDRHPGILRLLAPLAIDVERRKLVARIGERPVMLEALLECLVVIGGRAGDAGPCRALIEHRRQRRRMVHFFGQRSGLQEGRHAVIPMVVRVLDAAERIAGHQECDAGRSISC